MRANVSELLKKQWNHIKLRKLWVTKKIRLQIGVQRGKIRENFASIFC